MPSSGEVERSQVGQDLSFKKLHVNSALVVALVWREHRLISTSYVRPTRVHIL